MGIAVEDLRRWLRLDETTGRLFWREASPCMFASGGAHPAERLCRTWNARWAGREAFTFIGRKGYRHGEVRGVRTCAHVVVFALTRGAWPAGQVDHRNGRRGDNRPENLREATAQQNAQNGRSRGGSSRFKGVTWHERAGKWAAQSTDAQGRRRHLGLFAEEEDAAKAHDRFVSREHGAFARPNFTQTQGERHV